MTHTYRDIEYELKKSSRKTTSIYIERDGSISVLAPEPYEIEKIEEKELKIKKQKEMEEIDQKAKISWEKKLEEERKKSEIEQTKTDEKRKQWELVIGN